MIPRRSLYTSGTTGAPKGVVLTQTSMLTGARNANEATGVSDGDRSLCTLPLYHVNAQVVTTLGSLISGGSVVMPHGFQPGTTRPVDKRSAIFDWDAVPRRRCRRRCRNNSRAVRRSDSSAPNSETSSVVRESRAGCW
jgi:acyl-CoA synthetase (AMP-forming)/AMP-acid ligase II